MCARKEQIGSLAVVGRSERCRPGREQREGVTYEKNVSVAKTLSVHVDAEGCVCGCLLHLGQAAFGVG